jgi:hypothetical protein
MSFCLKAKSNQICIRTESTLKFTLHQSQMVLLPAALLAVTAQHAAIVLMGFACGVRILRCALNETLIW